VNEPRDLNQLIVTILSGHVDWWNESCHHHLCRRAMNGFQVDDVSNCQVWMEKFNMRTQILFQIHHPIFIIFQNHTSKYFTRWNEHSYWLKRVYDEIIKSESEYPNQILMSISNHKIHNQCGYKLVLAFSLESDKLWEFQILSISVRFLLPKFYDAINMIEISQAFFAVRWPSIKTVFSIFYWQL